ncbi:MAG: hypothetical protein ACRC7S_13190 [Cetobacterium sp.]
MKLRDIAEWIERTNATEMVRNLVLEAKVFIVDFGKIGRYTQD